jgi:threonine/homoserine/homoserine lactone efflux protein
MEYKVLLGFISAVAALAISPGPDNIFVLMQSVVHGKKFGLATVAGLMTGCIIHTSFVAFGISAILKRNDMLFIGIKLLGALYLLFLAFKVFKSDAGINLSHENLPKKSTAQLFKQGFIMNVLNPKVSLFFLAIFPSFLFSETLHSIVQFYILGFLFILTSFLIFSLIAILSAYISVFLKEHKKTGIILKWLQIFVFIGLAAIILFSEK